MFLDDIDDTIQLAEKQETMAYKAKKQAYHDLQKHIDRRYGDDLKDHHKVRNYAVQVKPSYESSNIRLSVILLLEEDQEKCITQVRESDDIEEDFRLLWNFRNKITEEVRRDVFDDLDIETDINIKVKTEEEFERMKERYD